MSDATMSWNVVRLTQVYKLMGEEWGRAVNSTLVGILNNEKDEEIEDGYTNSESLKQERFTVGAVMEEVLRNMVQVTGEQSLLGARSDLGATSTEDIRQVT